MSEEFAQTKSAQLHLPTARGEQVVLELPMLTGTLGPEVLDISPLAKANVFTFDPGFMATASCASSITFIDGNAGILLHRGYPIEQLAERGHFLAIAYLLLHGEKPSANELAAFTAAISSQMIVPAELDHVLRGLPRTAHPMAILGCLTYALAGFYHNQDNHTTSEARLKVATQLIAKMPTLAAMAYRHTAGLERIDPLPHLSYMENFLYMTFGEAANPTLVRALDKIFILHADHEQNASTSTVRLAGSTGTDAYSAIAAGISALWGPAHGGANEAALRMLQEIGSVQNIETYLARAKDPNDPFRLMGFGHRVYKNYDPRAKVMRSACLEVLHTLQSQNEPLFELAMKLEQIALEDPYFIQRKLYPNVDFYSGITLSAMGIPLPMFTVIFALARTSGWIAHWHEMWQDPHLKIGRPRQLYCGHKRREYANEISNN